MGTGVGVGVYVDVGVYVELDDDPVTLFFAVS
jgi:hypothetical protein